MSVVAVGCSASREVKLDADDNGSYVELDQGQILVVTLESNPSTGYRWEVVEPEQPTLKQIGEAEFRPSDQRKPPPPGTGGTETLRFEPQRSAETTLELVYHRPWESDEKPVQTFSVQVKVR
jgi:inhibitor of cysteine peptidase